MTLKPIAALAVLLWLPPLAHAAAYRCKAADGSLAFQDQPCAAGAKAPTYTLPSAQGYAPPPAASTPASAPAGPGSSGGTGRDMQQALDQLQAEQKNVRCANARRNLGVLREQRPVFSRDENGNRVYVDDKDRPAAVAAAQESADNNCD